jgi:agmatine deiminase
MMCAARIGISAVQSDIILDGGNVIKAKSWVILTDKVFLENPSLSEKQIFSKDGGVLHCISWGIRNNPVNSN